MRKLNPIQPSQNKDYRILIAHSDIKLAAEINFVFQSEGYEGIIAGSAEETLVQTKMVLPHLLVADAKMLELDVERGVFSIKHFRPNLLIFLIAMPTDVELAFQAAKQNVDGIVVVPIDFDKLVRRAGQKLADKFSYSRKNVRATRGIFSLTSREQQVLDLVSQGLSNKAIGLELKISPRTAEVHRARVMDKLGARNTAELVRIFLNSQ